MLETKFIKSSEFLEKSKIDPIKRATPIVFKAFTIVNFQKQSGSFKSNIIENKIMINPITKYLLKNLLKKFTPFSPI